MSTKEKVWAEVQQRVVSLFVKAPETTLLLEPRLLIESPTLRLTAHIEVTQSSGPKGALAIAPNQEQKLFTWSGDIDHPNILGPSALAVPVTKEEPGSGYERRPAPPGTYTLTLFSFLDGEPLSPLEIVLPPGNDNHALRPQDALDDHSFVRAFLNEAKDLPEEVFWIKPGRYEEKEIAEMAYLVEQTQIPSMHRELLLRCKRLQLLEHDLVTPPIIADDLEQVRVHARDRDLFPWFALKPYDSGDFICFDLENGGLVRARQLEIEPIGESPRQYLLKLLQIAKER